MRNQACSNVLHGYACVTASPTVSQSRRTHTERIVPRSARILAMKWASIT